MNIDISYIDWQIDFFFNWRLGVKYKICRKGRRAGVTRGAAHAIIEYLLEGSGPVLWGETTHGNIERYYERYFQPVLKQNKIEHKFDRQGKKLTIGDQYCDFRSADNPENWEGFGYKFIFLNEAGIILKNRSLYINSVLPMLLDHPDSKLIAAGVPKGKMLKDGTEHPFYTLSKRAEEEGNPQYEPLHLTSYDNPLLNEKDIKDLETEIEAFSPEQVNQEINGEFIDMDALNPFAHKYNPAVHESELSVFNPSRQVIMRVDFNLNPFAITFGHFWQDSAGYHWHVFDEAEIKNGSVPAMIDLILDGDEKRRSYRNYLHSAKLTGDAMGNRKDIGQRDNASNYKQLIRGLGMSESQLKVPGNPTHENSRSDVNYVLTHFPDYKINPKTCPNLCRDMKLVQCDAFGEIIKRDRKDVNQRADYLDTERYGVNTFLKKWIDEHQKLIKRRPVNTGG